VVGAHLTPPPCLDDISGLAHGTSRGLWMEDQKRYDDLMDSNRFTLAVYRRLEFALG
jgi:hypothetical protein